MLDLVIKVGVALLPEVDPAQDRRWSRVEEYGFAHAWSLDHLAWRAFVDSDLVRNRARAGRRRAHDVAAVARHLRRLTELPAPGPLRQGAHDARRDVRRPAARRRGSRRTRIRRGRAGRAAAVRPASEPIGSRSSSPCSTCCCGSARPPGPATGSQPSRRGRSPDPAAAAATARRRGQRSARHAAGAPHRGRVGHQRSRRTTRRGTGRRRVVEWRGGGCPPTRRRRRKTRERRPAFAGSSTWPSGWALPGSLEQMRDHLGRAEALGFTDVVIAWPRDSEPLRGSRLCWSRLGALLVDGSLAP